jgi:cbb3-type cytochrome c oxidase subunit III
MDMNETACDIARVRRWRRLSLAMSGLLASGMTAGLAAWYEGRVGSSAWAQEAKAPGDPPAEPLDFGEFLARPEALTSVPINDIARSSRLNAMAMISGKEVYDRHCAECHGADLKGSVEKHAPNLADSFWMFSGDDLPSGGTTKYASDVEYTIRYGVRSGNENARGNKADMLAYDPRYRNANDLHTYGDKKFLTDEEITDVAEYVLKLSGQPHAAAKAERGDALFQDNAKGNCADCHMDDGTGNDALGSANLTQKQLFLYGPDRASIIETITRGRRGVMPAFEGTLSPSELKSVSIYVFSFYRP